MALEIDTKFEENLICVSKNYMRNLVNFHQEHVRKSKNWNFYEILLLFTVENV